MTRPFTIRDLATSATALVFLVVGMTGVMMYFHWFDAYTKEMHETLGLAFVAAAILHVYVNWRAMRGYFSKKLFLILLAVVAAVSAGFLLNAKSGPDPKRIVLDAVLKAPLEVSAGVLGQDLDAVKTRLHDRGIEANATSSIDTLSKANRMSPFALVGIIINKENQ